jgi:hypothetical protein
MATAISNGTFTFNPEEVKELSSVIKELSFGAPGLASIHDVQTGIKHKQQIVFAGKMGLLGKKVSGCTPNQVTGITLTQKFWDPVFEDFRLEHCTADVNQQDKLVNQMARMNPDYATVIEGSQSVVGNFLIAAVLEALPENLWFKVWFNDKVIKNISDSGVLKNGISVDFFNGFDGIFKQIFATTSLATGGKYFTSIAKNAGASYALQALAANDAINAMKSVYNKADSRLRARTDAKFLVTRSVYDALVNDLEDKQNAGGFTQINENGLPVLRYRGLEVVMMDVWDRFIDTYTNNGTKWNIPHRIVLTVASNIPVGTLATEDLDKIEAFYDQYRKLNVIDGIYSLDAKLLEDYLTCVAY